MIGSDYIAGVHAQAIQVHADMQLAAVLDKAAAISKREDRVVKMNELSPVRSGKGFAREQV
jgi:hypothetical protein